MGFNDSLGPLVNVEGATSISIILLVDVDMGSFSPYKYVPTPWAKHTKTTIRGAPSLGNPSCSKLDFSPPSLVVAVAVAVAVAAALPNSAILSFMQQIEPTPAQLLLPWPCGGCTRGQRMKTRELRNYHHFVISSSYIRFKSVLSRSNCVRFVSM